MIDKQVLQSCMHTMTRVRWCRTTNLSCVQKTLAHCDTANDYPRSGPSSIWFLKSQGLRDFILVIDWHGWWIVVTRRVGAQQLHASWRAELLPLRCELVSYTGTCMHCIYLPDACSCFVFTSTFRGHFQTIF